MTDTTPAPEGVTPEQVAAILKDVTPTRSDPLASGHTALVKWLRNPWRKCDDVARGPIPEWTIGLMHEAATMLEALAADRDAQKARADALRHSYDELYADALADARSDAQEFEGELWKLLRDYLTKLNLDWSDYTDDGITAEQAIEHIRECMDGETARADALAKERDRFEAALARCCQVGGQTYYIDRIQAAEAKVARLVDAMNKIKALGDNAECCGQGECGGYSPPECCGQPLYGLDRAQNIARAIIAEVQG